MKIVKLVALILLIIGGLNWGLVGALNINVVSMLFGDMTVLSRAIYCLVGLAALYKIAGHLGLCKCCHTECSSHNKDCSK